MNTAAEIPFVHLHVHTQYSLLDGAARIPELVDRAKTLGQTALAITDHGVMYGVIEFYRACKKAGIKPILGMEAYVAPHGMDEKSSTGPNAARTDRYAHLVLLCKNETGYKNLMRLSSEAFTRGFYYKPRIDYDLLSRHCEGLVCLSACLAGDIPRYLAAGEYNKARDLGRRLKDMFGEDFYIELQNHGIPDQVRILPELRRLAKELQVKTVATNDIHYVNREDAEAQDVLLCIQTQRFVDERDRMRMEADEFYLKSAKEMLQVLPQDEEALRNTAEVAEKCNVELRFGERLLPRFDTPDNMDHKAYLTMLCEEGMAKKMGGGSEEARARLSYEIGVIDRMGFIDYFLIVWDFIHFAKTHGIEVGPGRGSAAGSLVAYCMDITDVDPMKYGLLFERFLNPERVSMPDIDVDFCYERRQEVIDYVTAKYGEGRVTQIITFGTMAARAVLRDVGRVLRVPYADCDKLAKMVPAALNMTLAQALQLSPELKAAHDTDETMRKVIDLSMKLEGLPRHSSTHAAGVVISGVDLMDVVPLQVNDTVVTTQFPAPVLEELGLLKMDFLGLRTLTVIRDALAYARKKDPGVRFPDDFDDPNVYSLMTRGDTDGVFQLESVGMRQFLSQLKPDRFEDLIAGISLYRPGPMDQIPRYVRGKHDASSVTYTHPLLQPILKDTYGCMVYQEQVMEIVRSLAGYSYGRSDLVRRAMAKKKHDVMAKEREFFLYGTEGVEGALKRGVSEEAGNKIFDEMMDFASYAFNKSHAAVYAVLAYRTGWLKHYYPVEFLTALINSFMGSMDKVAEYVFSARKAGIRVLPPDVNKSRARFSVEDGAIRFGLAGIRGVGTTAMEAMVRSREEGGPFKDLQDFCARTGEVNKRMVEGLICAGAFDGMGYKRSQLLQVYEQAIDYAARDRKERMSGQMSLFDFGDGAVEAPTVLKIPDIPELPPSWLLMKEREALGMYFSGHPLDEWADILNGLPLNVRQLQEADGLTGIEDGQTVQVAGMLTNTKQRPTKNGNGLIGYGNLEGLTGSVEVVVFPNTLTRCLEHFRDESRVLVKGRLNIREDRENSLLIEDLKPLDRFAGKTLYLRLPLMNDQYLERATRFLKMHPGETPVVLVDGAKRTGRQVPKELFIDLTDDTLQRARDTFGKDHVVIK